MESYKFFYANGVPKNEKKAKKLCLKSCYRGNKFAKGMKYYFGWETKKNEKKAFQLFTDSLNEDPSFQSPDTSYSLNFIAFMHYNGRGDLKVDILKAIQLYEKAFLLNNSSAMFNLAIIYEEGKEGFIFFHLFFIF